MKTLHIHPYHLSDVATLPRDKSLNSNTDTYLRLFTLSQKKTNCNCVLQLSCLLTVVYCFLLSAQPHYCVWGTLQEEHVYRVPVCNTNKLQQWLVATWAEFEHRMV